jgi:hypothetical protein
MTTPTPTQFALGQQDDGSIIVRLPDEFHRVILQKAIEKQHKNAGAAEGTIGALADGADPFLSRIKAALDALVQLIIGARPPGAQLDGTPIGAALANATLRSDPITWAPHVPEPRPKVGDLVRWPTGQTESLIGVAGYDADLGAFAGASEETQFGSLVASPVAGEWRLLTLLLDYADAENAADVHERAQDTAHDATVTSESGSVTDTSNTGAGNQSVTPPARKPSAQRERNAQRAGVGKPIAPKAPTPKKSAAPASPKKKGGK